MANAIKFPVFKGIGNKALDQFCFLAKAVWEAQGIIDYNLKKANLVSVLQDHALTWYIKYSSNHHNAGIVAIQDALNKEFSRPKSEMQSIIGLK